MNDFLGREIQAGDGVVVCHSYKTNSTLIYGVVTEVLPKSIKYRVDFAGAKDNYSNWVEVGEERRVYSPHRIALVEPDKE